MVSFAHCSPAGIKAIFFPSCCANSATALAFLKQPQIVTTLPVANVSVEPLGEGNTRRVPGAISSEDAGDSEKPDE